MNLTRRNGSRVWEFPAQQSCERLAETWDYCREKTQGHPRADLLLWRGVEMVEILSTLSMDIDTLRAAMLFPLADGNVVTEEVMQESVGKSVVTLIHGVRDMAAIRQLKATHTDSVSSEQVDNIRRMLLAMVDDFRCVVIKLAERIAHLREVKDEPEDERVLAAKECTNIYAPLANRLGIGQLKWELEDYCFRYLHPDEYKRIAKLLHERRIDREHYIDEFVGHLRSEMKTEGVKAEVYGRPKHIYSIWRKMQKKHLTFDELFGCARGTYCRGAPAGLLCRTGDSTHSLSPSAGWSSMITLPTQNQMAISRFIPWCWGRAVKRWRSRFVPGRCMKMRSWGVRRALGSTKKAPERRQAGGRGYEDRIAWAA
ncbi:GTP pyrophosphokinase [Raoultella planticola]|uniref:GTP pyrophosphokinase n=1 Tax=Raoultella planticola TaxID=575 RepID=A0A485BVP5_RAOPL|nr:GTP pyrophosphokinase [Raoultella planticola]